MVDNMKNMINYYYDIKIEKIIYNDNKYYIITNEKKYLLKEIDERCIHRINEQLINQLSDNIFFLKIIRNIYGNIITSIDNKKYVLLEYKENYDSEISIYDIKKYYVSSSDNNVSVEKWINLWENKVDSLEILIENNKQRLKKVIPLFEYFIGICENSIQFLKKNLFTIEMCNLQYVISHERININTKLWEYYDSTSVMFDYISRDIAEYVKSEIINNRFEIVIFEKYLESIKLTNTEIKLLMARCLFPTFFFDYIENTNQVNVEHLEKIIEVYEQKLKCINMLLNNKYGIEKIEWLHNKKKIS